MIEAGARVALVDRDAAALKDVCAELGAAAVPVTIDLMEPRSVATMLPQILEIGGQLDIFHANAGAYVGGEVVAGDPDIWDRMLNLNINAAFRSVHAVLPHMIERKTGDIVLTSSIASGNQWRLNGTDISGATTQQHTATVSGLYRVANTDDLGCVGLSSELNVVVTSVNNVDPAKIGLLLAPNPNSGRFNVRFRVNGREQLDIAVQNMLGQQVFKKTFDRFSGEFNDQIQLQDAAPGIYMLKITHGDDHYVRRILIQ